MDLNILYFHKNTMLLKTLEDYGLYLLQATVVNLIKLVQGSNELFVFLHCIETKMNFNY